MEQVEALGALQLADADGQTVRLGELWKERPAVIIWLRHYG